MLDILRELAERTPEPELIYWVESRPMCARCRWHEVSMPDDLCELCIKAYDKAATEIYGEFANTNF